MGDRNGPEHATSPFHIFFNASAERRKAKLKYNYLYA
jgi:hypothetical protein